MLDIALHKAIRQAIKQGELRDVIRLIGNDRSRLSMMTPFGTWLHVAAAHGKLDIVKWLVEMGADVNAYGGITGGGPLDEAASNGHYDVVKFLIESGAVLDTSDSVHNPLFAAIYGGHTDVARLLIDSGIDIGCSYTGQYMHNMDAVAFAEEWGRSDIVELLKAKLRKP